MSITGLPYPEKMFKKSHNQQDDSGELDVFEAAKYFSEANEIYTYSNNATFAQKVARDHQDKQNSSKAGRFSLDMPTRNSIPSSQTFVMEKQMTKENKKHKQPSSPGGKLANFLNSLFSQTSSRKKKSKSKNATVKSMKDEDESPGWRRKRRSSISHFRSASNPVDSNSVYPTSGTGFITPPHYANTPTKSYREFRRYLDHQQVISASKQPENPVKSVVVQNGIHPDKNIDLDYAWLDEKFMLVDQIPRSFKNVKIGGNNHWADCYLSSEEKRFRKFNDLDDDGADSDSSSDLFELPNYDLDCYSSGLPVYETTSMDSVKKNAALSVSSVP